MRKLLFSLLFLISAAKVQSEEVRLNDQVIWYDTFGDEKNEPFLLIMGGGCPATMWPREFCNQLVDAGFYVIRFDHRDTGYSSYYDFFRTPYTLLDMAGDAKKVLEHLNIEKAHICGASMGGGIAQLFGAYFPEKTRSLILMGTTADIGNLIDCLERKPPRNPSLSIPSLAYLKWMADSQTKELLTFEELIEKRLAGWRLLNGPILPFEEELCRNLQIEAFQRQKEHNAVLNHIYAIKFSVELVKNASGNIHVPTLIIHGGQDPIFLKDHMLDLQKRIPAATTLFIEEMGHNLNSFLYPKVVQTIREHTQGK